MPTIVSSYVQTLAGAVDTRTADSLTFPFVARPQAMSIYVKFQERGTINVGSSRIFQIGSSDADPRLFLFVSSGFYALSHDTGATSRTVMLAAAPVVGQIVELLAQLNANGSITLLQSIAGASPTTTSTSTALVLAPAWSGAFLHINSSAGTGSGSGVIGLLNLLIVRGVQDMATMRRLAGTDRR